MGFDDHNKTEQVMALLTRAHQTLASMAILLLGVTLPAGCTSKSSAVVRDQQGGSNSAYSFLSPRTVGMPLADIASTALLRVGLPVVESPDGFDVLKLEPCFVEGGADVGEGSEGFGGAVADLIDPNAPGTGGGSEGVLDAMKDVSASDVMSKMNVDMSGAFQFSPTYPKFTGAFSFAKENSETDTSSSHILMFRLINRRAHFKNTSSPKFTKFGYKARQEHAFLARCGTHYIQAMDFGSMLSVSLTINTGSAAEKEMIKAAFGIEYGVANLAKLKGEMRMKLEQSTAHEHLEVKLAIKTIGFDFAKVWHKLNLGDTSTSGLTCNVETIDHCLDMFNNVLTFLKSAPDLADAVNKTEIPIRVFLNSNRDEDSQLQQALCLGFPFTSDGLAQCKLAESTLVQNRAALSTIISNALAQNQKFEASRARLAPYLSDPELAAFARASQNYKAIVDKAASCLEQLFNVPLAQGRDDSTQCLQVVRGLQATKINLLSTAKISDICRNFVESHWDTNPNGFQYVTEAQAGTMRALFSAMNADVKDFTACQHLGQVGQLKISIRVLIPELSQLKLLANINLHDDFSGDRDPSIFSVQGVTLDDSTGISLSRLVRVFPSVTSIDARNLHASADVLGSDLANMGQGTGGAAIDLLLNGNSTFPNTAAFCSFLSIPMVIPTLELASPPGGLADGQALLCSGGDPIKAQIGSLAISGMPNTWNSATQCPTTHCKRR